MFKLDRLYDLSEKELKAVDNFILSENTNGEFINTVKYMDYHPKTRFSDDSVVVRDAESAGVRAVMLAAKDLADGKVVISHPGTSFAGIVLDSKLSMDKAFEAMSIIENYYETKYERIVIRTRPSWYDRQPMGKPEYFLMRNGYQLDMTAFANVIDISQISDEEDILKLFDSKRRNEVRKTLKEGLFFLEKDTIIRSAVWDNMNSNLKERFDSHTTHSFEEISDLMRRYPDNIVPYYEVTEAGEYGAFALIYKFKNVFHTQYLDVNYTLSRHYPNLALIYSLIMEARKEGYTKFSLGPSTEEQGKVVNSGLYSYKAGYGGGDMIMPVFYKEIN